MKLPVPIRHSRTRVTIAFGAMIMAIGLAAGDQSVLSPNMVVVAAQQPAGTGDQSSGRSHIEVVRSGPRAAGGGTALGHGVQPLQSDAEAQALLRDSSEGPLTWLAQLSDVGCSNSSN